jgi:BlaI family transcriptional regulator, penicillinase repressor
LPEDSPLSDELPPSERELDILKVLWEIGSGKVRDVHDCLFPKHGLAFNTVQTLLRNMEAKGLVGHRADGRMFIYFPTHTREQVTSRFLSKVFGGDLDQFVLSVLLASDASPDQLRGLEELVAKAREEKQRTKRSYPPIGAAVAKGLPTEGGMPPYITLDGAAGFPGAAGCFGTSFSPFNTELGTGRGESRVKGIALPFGFATEKLVDWH